MIFILILICIVLLVMIFLRRPPFGKGASGVRLATMQKSPNFKNGRFQNQSFTPDLKEGVGYFTVMGDFFFNKSKRAIPSGVIPSVKTDLHTLPTDQNLMVWFGHSSYYLQVDGKRILVDPVFSGHASPVSFTTKSFKGTDVYAAAEMPLIDYLFITHDHWDHLDYSTMKKLQPKIKKVITGLGVGAHLESWGFPPEKIIEKDWYDEIVLDSGFKVVATPARHFSGRSLKRNRSLWLSFVLYTPTMRLFLGGDSGYDSHFKHIGHTYGPFDVAILECGQYNEYWKYIHMMPEEVVKASRDLKAGYFIPLHWSKFSLSLHAWDEPIIRVTEAAKKENVPIKYGMIGEAIDLGKSEHQNNWWKNPAVG